MTPQCVGKTPSGVFLFVLFMRDLLIIIQLSDKSLIILTLLKMNGKLLLGLTVNILILMNIAMIP